MFLQTAWQRITKSRRTREREAAAQYERVHREGALRDDFARRTHALESQIAQAHAENCRLRAENRALLNSVLGIAGIPPVIVADPSRPSAGRRPRSFRDMPASGARMTRATMSPIRRPRPVLMAVILGSEATKNLSSFRPAASMQNQREVLRAKAALRMTARFRGGASENGTIAKHGAAVAMPYQVKRPLHDTAVHAAPRKGARDEREQGIRTPSRRFVAGRGTRFTACSNSNRRAAKTRIRRHIRVTHFFVGACRAILRSGSDKRFPRKPSF